MKDTKGNYRHYLTRECGLNEDSEEFDAALGQWGIEEEDNVYYLDFLNELEGQ